MSSKISSNLEVQQKFNSYINFDSFDVTRLGKVLLPFLSLYKPLSQPMAIASGSLKVIASGSQIFNSTKEELPQQLLQTSIATVALASTILAHPLGMLVTTGEDLAIELRSLYRNLKTGDHIKTAENCANILNNTLYLGVLMYGSMQIAIASFALQTLLGLYHSHSEFKEGNYLEAAGHFAMAMFKANQTAQQVFAYRAIQPVEDEFHILPINEEGLERRAVIDVGSGSTKFCIADIDRRTNTIAKIILNESYAVPYQAALETSNDQTFDQEIRDQGLKTFSKIEALCKEYGVQKTTAVATEAFRKSMNGEAFAQEVREKTSLGLRIIPQKEEGAIAFSSVASQNEGISPDHLVVWDIGTGSSQITVKSEEDDVSVFMGNMGSVPFRNYIKGVVQGKNPSDSTLHPFSEDDYSSSDRYARSLARQAVKDIKQRIRETDGNVVGVGRLFNNSLSPLAQNEEITRADLRRYIRSSIGKPKEQFDDPFSEADLANATLVLAYMKALHIHKINPVNAATLQGMLTYEPYWNGGSL
jgi:exopolyphosphatase/guanosine-5'-triphosphate,3'-diphosphate pyrophosphatase